LTRHARLEVSQVPPAGGDGAVRDGQQRSELLLSYRVTLESQDQSSALRTVRHSNKLIREGWVRAVLF
jgi:hypothetical protein